MKYGQEKKSCDIQEKFQKNCINLYLLTDKINFSQKIHIKNYKNYYKQKGFVENTNDLQNTI